MSAWPRPAVPFVRYDGRFLIISEGDLDTCFTNRRDVETYVFDTRGYADMHVEYGTPGWGDPQ